MNTPILARVDQSDAVGQGSRRKPSSPRPENRRAKLLATILLAAPMLASTMLLSPGMGEAANAGHALLYPTGYPTRVADAHTRGTTYRATPTAHKATTHSPLLAGRHHAHITKGAG